MSLNQTSVGQIVNLISNDVSRFEFAFIFIHIIWIGPIQTAIGSYLIWRIVGSATLLGMAILLIIIPFQGWLGKEAAKIRLKATKKTDERINLMNEIITGIQVIKMYTWEIPFSKLVSAVRSKEIGYIKKISYVKSITLSLMIFHTRAAIFVTILMYVLYGNAVTAEKVFVLSTLYNILRPTMTIFFPQSIYVLSDCKVSIDRITTFLMINPKEPEQLKGTKECNDQNGIHLLSGIYTKLSENFVDAGIFVKNATAKWSEENSDNTLNNINLDVVPGKLTVIIGTVGSGKSSLFHALLNELNLSSGSIKICGKISYASQESWLFNGSVRQNILFGEEYNEVRYKKVIKNCALITDINQFPHGDKSIVGERGISLSGGQRARISLARAVYKNADVYLLDDPLSAVDPHVGKHIFEECIQDFLKDKTVILITHQLQYLEFVPQIALLENGNIIAKGTYSELQKSGLDFTKLMTIEKEEKVENDKHLEGQSLTTGRSSKKNSISMEEEEMKVAPADGKEMQTKGSVSGSVYKTYMRSGKGFCFVFLIFFLCVFAQVIASGSDYWLAYWVNLEEHVYNKNETETFYNGNSTKVKQFLFIVPRDICIYVFSGSIAAMIAVTLLRSFMFFNMCMLSSKNLHGQMFNSITRSSINFFNKNPTGRILNRFSKDMGAIDDMIPSVMMDVLQIGISFFSILIVVASVNPWLLIPSIFFGIVLYYMRIMYVTTSRNVKRLEGITRSPVYSHVNASLQGLTTIRAFNAQEVLKTEFDYHQDSHSSAWFLFNVISHAFGFYLDVVCLMYIALTTVSFLILEKGTFGGDVGLAITQSIGLTGMFQWGMRQTAELENQMTSVERVIEYSNLESEPPLESSPEKKPRNEWPQNGKIEFKNVSLRYNPDDPWVLKKLCFTIEPNEKVGIVGRTGAGKSSLITSLFRLALTEGSIDIDQVNTSGIGLRDLRSKIAIIPQDPFLFSGTLRKNLDPFDEFNDEVMWSALDEVELRDAVQELSNGLQSQISEGGSNLSVGQRQLLCLARAIIRNNKILVLDEATANVDPKTDFLIQKTIRKKFAECTVLTIAHRLNTVMDSDRILVIDEGSLVEFDHPHLLLQNINGYLYKMVQQTGDETLRRIAAANFKMKQDNWESIDL